MGARATWICARATRRGARASDVCKGHILCLYTKILIWCKGLIFCLLKFWNILRPLHHFLWPLHMALAPLLVALALALAPRKMLLFSRLSGSHHTIQYLSIYEVMWHYYQPKTMVSPVLFKTNVTPPPEVIPANPWEIGHPATSQKHQKHLVQ